MTKRKKCPLRFISTSGCQPRSAEQNKDEGLVVEDEIVRLKEMEKDSEAIGSLAAVLDWSVAGLDLPQVSEDSIVDDEAVSSSAREEASS